MRTRVTFREAELLRTWNKLYPHVSERIPSSYIIFIRLMLGVLVGGMMQIRILFICILFSSLCLAQTVHVTAPASVAVTVHPERPLIEHRGTVQLLNFDFLLQNTGPNSLHLNRIAVSISDKRTNLILRRQLDENGRPSGLSTVSQLDIPSGGRIGRFNPFYEFASEINIEKRSYEFFFNDPGYKTATPLTDHNS